MMYCLPVNNRKISWLPIKKSFRKHVVTKRVFYKTQTIFCAWSLYKFECKEFMYVIIVYTSLSNNYITLIYDINYIKYNINYTRIDTRINCLFYTRYIQRTEFLFPFKLQQIWSYWQFYLNLEPNGIMFGLKSKRKLSVCLYSFKFERKQKSYCQIDIYTNLRCIISIAFKFLA